MDPIFIFLLLIFWTGIAFIVGTLGQERKIGQATAFWVSFLTSPIIGLLVVIASEKVEKTEKPSLPELILNQEPTISNEEYQLANDRCNIAVKYFKDGDIDSALKELGEGHRALPTHPLLNFNLACGYSRKKDASTSLKYLKEAIRNGYNKFDDIKTDSDLIFLREQH